MCVCVFVYVCVCVCVYLRNPSTLCTMGLKVDI